MNRKTTMKTANGLTLVVLATLALYLPEPARADDQTPAEPDTSKWKCKFCQFEEGRGGLLDLGLGAVSDDSFKFGEYSGLDQQGGFLVGNLTGRYRGEDAAYLDLSATNLGLDTRTLGIEGGKQGKYKLFLKYAELPHNISDTAQTIFTGAGSSVLTFPGVLDPNTGNPVLRDVDLYTKRKRIDLGASLIPVTHWEYAVKFRHETKDGQRGTSGTFMFSAAQLIQPVDYTTDQVDVSAAYNGAKLQAKMAYYGSIFNNSDASLTWQNPYVTPGTQPGTGQLALPPSNQFHQIVLTSGYQFTDRTRAMGEVAIGRMTQDEAFLPATTNTSLPAIPLPRASLDGQVDTVNANVKLVSTPIDKLRLNAAYTYSDRNNKTPQSTYQWVSTDTFPHLASDPVVSTRTNQPYSFTRNLVNLSADYRLSVMHTKLGAGYDYDNFKRSLQDIAKNTEQTFWGKVNADVSEKVDVMLKLAHASRDASEYQPNPEIYPPNNPLMRKYDMADRDRDTVGFHTGITPVERLNIDVGLDYAWDNYSKSVVGLLDGVQRDISGDASLVLTDKATLNFFANHEQIKSSQGGSEANPTIQDWSARNDDTADTAGLGVKYSANEKLDLGAEYSASRTTGQITISDFNFAHAGQPFPDLTTKLDTVKLYGTYKLKPGVALHAAYWYERYDSTDWTLDGVTPFTIPGVYTLGQLSPAYHVNVVTLSVRYSF
jgi:MtrB/PioB family decaheme-associated outer membrane protein